MTEIDEGTLRLMGELMASNAAQTTGIVTDVLASTAAERDCLRDGIRAALSTVIFGGTTAQYETALNRIERVLYPTEEIKAWYRERLKDNPIHLPSATDPPNPWEKLWGYTDGDA